MKPISDSFDIDFNKSSLENSYSSSRTDEPSSKFYFMDKSR